MLTVLGEVLTEKDGGIQQATAAVGLVIEPGHLSTRKQWCLSDSRSSMQQRQESMKGGERRRRRTRNVPACRRRATDAGSTGWDAAQQQLIART